MDVFSWFRRSVSSSTKNSTPSSTTTTTTAATKNGGVKDDEVQLYGITDQLIEFVKSFSFDTFRNFSLPDEEEGGNGGAGDRTSTSVRKDLSEWQERHAMLVLSKVKELSQLRFRLCPRYLKEREFWRIYFTLVRSYIAEYSDLFDLIHLMNELNCTYHGAILVRYELQSIRLAKIKQMSLENETRKDVNTYEVEMSETKQAKSVVRADSFGHD